MIHGEGAGPCWLAGAFEPFEAVAHVAKGGRDSGTRRGGILVEKDGGGR